MSTENPEFWQRANKARDKLSLELFGQPQISLIDIGYDPKDQSGSGQLFLRVHVRYSTDIEKLAIPAEVDGIPVITIIADYRLE